MNLTRLCGYLKNWFERDSVKGTFTIENGALPGEVADKLLDGQYFRIVGSILNDGVHKYTADTAIDTLHDETFTGAVWLLAIPSEVVEIAEEIEAWNEKNADAVASPFQSESLSAGSYSYTKASGDSIASLTWQNVFASRLTQWRKI